MSGNDQAAEVSKPKVATPEQDANEKLFEDSVKDLTASIKNDDVTGGLKRFDEKLYQLDLGPAAADQVINNVFEELKKTGELPNLVSSFYAENKKRLLQDGKSYLDLESLDKRLPGGGVYDLNRAERHVAAFIADNINKISDAKWNPTYSTGQTSDADFTEYAKQQGDELYRFKMAQLIKKHFGSESSFNALDKAGYADGKVYLDDIAAASKMNSWLADFSQDKQTKELAAERQQVLDYLTKTYRDIPGVSFGLDRTELSTYIASQADPRTGQVLDKNNRLFGGNPGPEAYQKAVKEGYSGSLNKFTTDFIEARVKEGMTPQDAMRELNRSTELSGYRADVIKEYLNANKEALGASRTGEITKESLVKLKERKISEGKLREVEILENAINRFESIANKVKDSSWFNDDKIKSDDLDAYVDSEKQARTRANQATKMHNLAYHNIHELSGENKDKKPYDIKVPWSKISSMKQFYEAAGNDPAKFTEEQRTHHKEMKELCDYLERNFKTSTGGRGGVPAFDLYRSFNSQKEQNKHNLDRFDAPKESAKTVKEPVKEPVKEQVKEQVKEPVKEPVIVETKQEEEVQPVEVKKENNAPELFKRVPPGEYITGPEWNLGQPRVWTKEAEEEPVDMIPNQPADVEGVENAGNTINWTGVADPQYRPAINPDVTRTGEVLNQAVDKIVIPGSQNLYDFTGDGDKRISNQSDPALLPRDQRPATPDEFERGDMGMLKPEEKVEQKAETDILEKNEFDKLKEAFQYDAASYRNALRQAARENKPLVLIGGTKNSSVEFLKAAAAQAANDKAVYVFVDLDNANPDLPITKYLESNIAQRNQRTGQHDDNWLSVFKVSSDGQGGVVNHSPEYFGTGSKAANSETLQKAIDGVIAKKQPQYMQSSNQGAVYQYEQYRPAANYYSSNCRPRRGVFGFRR